ncbi:hypothetical protein N7539_000707 [Penicillium diatomitis]|uniref:WD40 repeat-like protein n=1 Tax=Penicillium diatomitis TaxID=2819901 RepID=A0A9W9XM65_9EURO|nr:uncharacterized protein N7539_000707 [Penicillium diatomitis]KAJ5495591.1 hypothetical protein N7539_000707 [Penicillium diatomitis]
MSHHSLYFTRGTPRCGLPAFTLDFSNAHALEALTERLRQQYTHGSPVPPRVPNSDQAEHGLSENSDKFGHKAQEWVPSQSMMAEVPLVTPTFSKPKPINIALGNGIPSISSALPHSSVQRPSPTQTVVPAYIVTRDPITKDTTPVKEEPSARNDVLAGITAEGSPVAPQSTLPISQAQPSRPVAPATVRPADLRRSVALTNANRSQTSDEAHRLTPGTRHNSPVRATSHKKQGSQMGSQSSMSSPDYRPSSGSSQSSKSPEPSLIAPSMHSASPSRRRSSRARGEPVIYNLKKLSRKALAADFEDNPHFPYRSEGEAANPVFDLPIPSAALPRQRSSQPRQSSPPRPSHPPRASLHPRQTPQSRGYLQDLSDGQQSPSGPPREGNLMKLLWARELHGSRPNQDLLRATASSNLKPWKSWKGTSNDVASVTFSPDGTRFAAGSTALSDQYNRANNLVYGDIPKNTLYELPNHNVPRRVNAAMADERLFPTVSTVQWVDQTFYTASYDQTVKIWDAQDLSATRVPNCTRTLQHDSGVLVMGVSSKMPHLVATGTTHQFHLWNLNDHQSGSQSLQIKRDPRQKANIVLGPTVLGWGEAPGSKQYLVGGMAEQIPDNEMDEKKRFQVVNHGHLGLWKVHESSVEVCRIRGFDSQNIFDLKWHQTQPRFAIGSTYSQAMNLPLRSKSVVQLYDIESGDRAVVTGKCACAAADINEVTFCPMDSTYVTASCTEGSTYVWDTRFNQKPIHKLQHGPSVMALNPLYARELVDFGVRVALWGTTMDQFYTGATDGYLKQWDIRRSTEDALVANTAHLNDGITCGAFSADKSQLLLGDFGGGIHVLTCENTDEDQSSFAFKPAPDPASTEEPGIPVANELLDSRQLIMHPVYGPVQGPCYKGPYAAWARGLPPMTPADKIKRTPLLGKFQARQFDGPPIYDRPELDAGSRRDLQCQFNLARARHARNSSLGLARVGRDTSPRKRKRDYLTAYGGIEKDSQRHKSLSPSRRKSKKKKRKKLYRRSIHVITRIEDSVIDLTMDSGSDAEVTAANVDPAAAPVSNPVAESAPVPMPVDETPGVTLAESSVDLPEAPVEHPGSRVVSLSPVIKVLDEDSEEDFEDYWWPESGHVDANLSPDEL